MYRTAHSQEQNVNDENKILESSKQDKSISVPNAYASIKSRTALGVILDSTLNQSQTNPRYQSQGHYFPHSHQHDQQHDHQHQYQSNHIDAHVSHRGKIPILSDNQKNQVTHSGSVSTISTSEDVMDQSSNDEANYIHEEQDEEFESDDYSFNQPLSPIMSLKIEQEIDRVYTKFSRTELDPNDEDTYDCTMVAEYGNRIFNYLHELEIKYKPNPRYVEQIQKDLCWEHRSTLMDWLVQLHSRFNLLPETLFLAVNIIDRFLSKKTISLSRFQLCGAVALFIAAKYEEINVPTVSQMVYMVSNQYPRDAFLRAERFMVEVLGFEFGWPGPMSFLRRGSKADDYDAEVRTLAKYFLEITIMDSRFVSSPPSWLAAGAQYLSRRMLARGEWSEAHVYYTGYTAEQLEPLALYFEHCCLNAESHHKSIYQKYSERRFKRASLYANQYVRELYNS